MEVNRVENNEKMSTAELLAALLPGLCLWNKGNDPVPVGWDRDGNRAWLADFVQHSSFLSHQL